MKKKMMVIVLTLCLALTTCALVACNNDPPPEGGAWYAQAKVSGGTATLTFTSDTEWKLDCKGAFLSDDWNPWQSGTYEFDGKPGVSKLHMTATKESPNTFIKGKAAGEEATYEPTEGVYIIVFDVNGADTTFNLKPPTDGTKPDGSVPKEPCTEHVDENNDGKCDVCGEDMPAEEATVQLAMSATATSSNQVTAYGKLECKTDNTWAISIAYQDGGEYTKTASGTWAMNGYTAIVLTVTEDTANVLSQETYNITVDATDQTNINYSCTIACTVPQVGNLEFTFSNIPPKTVQLTMNAAANAAGQSAKIEVYTDNTWVLSICYYTGGGYQKTASGTWAMNGYTGMTLTVTTDTANVLAEDTYPVAFDMATTPGSIVYTTEMTCVVLQAGGSLTFNFTATMAIPA